MSMKLFSASFEIDSNGAEGRFKGVAAIFGNLAEAKELDVMLPGAFKRTLDAWAGKRIPLFWWHAHEEKKMPIGSITRAWESERGLEIEGEFAIATEGGRDAYELAKGKHVSGLSIGFLPIADKTERKKTAAGVVNFMREVRLFEVSLLPYPADTGARIESVHQENLGETPGTTEAFTEHQLSKQEMLSYLEDHLDPGNPSSIETCMAFLKKLTTPKPKEEADPEAVVATQQEADPETTTEASTQQESATPHSAESFTATATKEMADMLRQHWRLNNVSSTETAEDGRGNCG